MSAEHRVEVSKSGRVKIQVAYSLDLSNRDRLGELVSEHEKCSELELCFSCTARVDSGGLGRLISIGKRLRASGSTPVVTGLNRDIRAHFRHFGIDGIFFVSEDEEQAA